MSKSLNNFFTVRDVAQEYDYEVIRFFMLSAHYRNPVNFSKELMAQSASALERIYTCMENLEFLSKNAVDKELNAGEKAFEEKLPQIKQSFLDAMDDDLNTADAIAAIFDLVKAANTAFASDEKPSATTVEKAKSLLAELCGVLGLLKKDTANDIDAEIDALIQKRQEARAAKNWAEADAVRDKLKEMGITLKDTPMGVQIIRS